MADRGTAMTSRGRMLATLRREEVDRFPVWLKMANPTWSSSQPEPYRSMGGTALLQACGCDIIRGCGFPVQALRPRVEESIEIQADRRVHRIRTPDGELVGIEGLDPVTRSAHPLVYPVTTAEQLGRLRWLYTDTSYRADPARVEAARRQQQVAVDADSITMCGIGPGPLMHLVQHLCGPAAAVYLMTDEPALFGEVVALMHADRLRELAARIDGLAADTFWLTENTSTSLISPSLFRTWCVPHLTAYGSMVRGKGIIPVHHMCGMLNALLEDIDALPA
ncbi:MAG: hypothetical protein JXR77_18315, partial [Lentisphaeria bacterium]|nr:hypothetical protein [Lentisphaeria bacterium]